MSMASRSSFGLEQHGAFRTAIGQPRMLQTAALDKKSRTAQEPRARAESKGCRGQSSIRVWAVRVSLALGGGGV